ncbi:MAG: GAF domain-containing protein [Pseudomonadota bacterium]
MSDNHQNIKEQSRLNALLKLKVLDSPFETVFDTVTRIASDVCGTPIALISLIDDKRQWFKSNVGLENVTETLREISFCQYTIQNDGFFEVADASQDERFWDNPLVVGSPHIRFYCGSPIKLPMGENIGSLCVLDTKPNYLNIHQRKTIEGLAKLVSQLLVLREINLKNSHLDSDLTIDAVN